MYLNLKVAQKINELELNVREQFFICKYWSGKKGALPEWNIWRSNDAEKERANEEMGVEDGCRPPAAIPEEDSWKAGNQPDGTFVIPAPGAPALPLHTAPQPQSQSDAGPKEGETDLEKKLRESIALVQLRKAGAGAGTPAPVAATPEALPVHNTVNGNKPIADPSAEEARPGTGASSGNGVNGTNLGASNGSAKPDGNGNSSQIPRAVQFPWTEFLLAQTKALADVYAAAIDYAGKQHGNAIKPEDLRALMLSAFINLSQRGGTSAARVDR
jgi:hypothetical protein